MRLPFVLQQLVFSSLPVKEATAMKKFISALLALAATLALSSCGGSPTKMEISPASFSQETRDVLTILDDEIAFFDYVVEEPIQSVSYDLWFYEEGQWRSAGKVYGDASPGSHRIAVRVNDSTCDLYEITKSGHTKSSFPNEADFSAATMTGQSRLSNPTPIAAGKEIPLWLRLGTDQNGLSVVLSENFREVDCNAGLAVTVTFSEEAAD